MKIALLLLTSDNLSCYQPDQQQPTADLDLTFSLRTLTKEPTIAPACPQLLELFKAFKSPEWNNVRYADSQTQYLQNPGFTNLEVNEEVKRYDSSKTVLNTEKAFANITCALLKQRNALQSDLQGFLSNIKQDKCLDYETVCKKLTDAVTDGEYTKNLNDALQITCGPMA